jgi:5-methylcytosine-specific restriction endonuclease McrA/predicted nucleic acid-binding Zn ribbon protein
MSIPREKLISYCVVCGTKFNNKYKYDRVTCSKKCDTINKKGKRFSKTTEFKKGQKAWNKKEKIKRICIYCNKEYIPCYKKQKYCSSQCFVDDKIKGIPLSEQAKQKISMGLQKKSKFDKYCVSLNRRLRNTKRWILWREKVFVRDDYTCQRCGKRGIYIEPHHIISLKECIKKNNIEKAFDVFNGITLCRPCHMKTHKWKLKKNYNNKESD